MTCSIEIKNGRFRYNMWTKQKPNDTYTLFTSENGWIVKIDVMMEKITCHWINSGILSESDHKVFPLVDGRIILKKEVDEIAKNSARRVTLRGKINIENLEGVKELEINKECVSFLFSGESRLLIDALGRGEVKDFTVTEPDLEEVFLHYYKKEER